MKNKKEPIFIFGCTRGGTTLLRLMLNMHSQIAIPPESHFLIPILKKYNPEALLNRREISDVLKITYDHPRFQFWNINLKDLVSYENKIVPPISLKKLIDGLFRLQIKETNKPIWGDKTPEYYEVIPNIIKLFPKANIVAYTRDGRDVANSLKERGWYGWNIYQRAKYWRRTINETYALQGLDNIFFLKYETLITQPQKSLKLLCDFLEIEFESQMLDYNKNYKENITEIEQRGKIHEKLGRKPQKSDVKKWKINSTKLEIWKFESVAYRALSVAGYGIEYYKPNNVFHKLGKGFYFIQGEMVCFLYWGYYLPILRPFKDWIKSLKTAKI